MDGHENNLLGELFEDEQDCDMSRASLSLKLSSTGLEEETQRFWASIDRLLFRSPMDVATTVLEANGFVVNLENILACFDQMKLGIAANASSRREEGQPAKIKQYAPGLSFRLPAKGQAGDLLQKFYQEIAAYESELARLQGLEAEGATKEDSKKNERELRQALARERQRTATLEDRLAAIADEIKELRRSHARASQAIERQQLLPEAIRLGDVRAVDLKDRQVSVRSGRTTVQVPLAQLPGVPQPGMPCLLHFDDGQLQGAFFYGTEPLKPFALAIGTVIFVDDDGLKVRDHARRIHLIRYSNEAERERARHLRRGDRMVLSHVDDHILRFDPIPRANEDHFVDRIRAEQIQLSIGAVYFEALSVPADDLSDDDEEAA